MLTVILFSFCLFLFGCGDSANVTIHPTPNITTGNITGIVIDREFNKIPGAYVLGYHIFPAGRSITTDQTNFFLDIADIQGEYLLTGLPAGLTQIDCWPSEADHTLNPTEPVCSYRINIQLGQTLNQDLRYGYFFDPDNPNNDTGSVAGRVFENASSAEGAYILGYRIYAVGKEINTDQTNFYLAIADSQGLYSLKGIPAGLVQIDIWKDEADHEANYNTPRASYQLSVLGGMIFQQDLQFGNMANKIKK